MIIDAHNHPDWYGYSFDKFIENMEKNNIDKTCILTWDCPKHEYDPAYDKNLPHHNMPGGPIPLESCLAFANKRPDKFILGYAPDPRKPDAIKNLDYAIKKYDVKVYGELKLRMMFDNPDAIRMYRFCGGKRLPVVIHLDYDFHKKGNYEWSGYWYGGSIKAFDRALSLCPDTIFLGHAPGFWAHISKDEQYDKTFYPKGKVLAGGEISMMLDKYPNLYCDISANSGFNAFERDRTFAKQFIEKYQDRILYARDCFDNIHQELLNGLGLPESILEKLYWKNADLLFNIY